jgi:hypothetical protein
VILARADFRNAATRRLLSPARVATTTWLGSTSSSGGEHFDWLTPFVRIDNWVSSDLTQRELGWQPDQQGLIADLEAGHYFSDADRP